MDGLQVIYDREGGVITRRHNPGISYTDAKGNTFYMLYNGHGDVAQLVDVHGNIVQGYQYDAFGATGKDSNPSRYVAGGGVYSEDATGLQYMWNRWYDPQLGRFISRDPIGFGGSDINLYRYAGNNPVSWQDPFGLYLVKAGAQVNSIRIQIFLSLIEITTGESLRVTSGDEDIPQHKPGSPHRMGLAVDVGYPKDPTKILQGASDAGAQFGLDEKLHPSSKSTAPHLHLQLIPGKRGGRGDLPKKPRPPAPNFQLEFQWNGIGPWIPGYQGPAPQKPYVT
jgi:RHS repeat-associated protein